MARLRSCSTIVSRTWHSGKNVSDDPRRIFGARIVVSNDDVIGKFRSNPPHQRTLARVAITTTAEYNTKLTTAVGARGLQSLRKCIGRV